MENVVLVDENDQPIGVAAKDTVHTKNTPLHRGFSVFLFNSKKQTLLTKRASVKKTFPGVWTNAVCGHPAPGETVADAAVRRLHEEMGISDVAVSKISDYRYTFSDANGIVENEICPILVGYTDNNPVINADEVDEWKWLEWKDFLSDIVKKADQYSPWCREEAILINPLLHKG